MAPYCSSRLPSIERLGRLGALLLCGAAAPAWAQTLSNNTALSFGSFSAGSGGTVTVNAGGGRIKTGSVVLSSQGTSSPAQFTFTGTPGNTVVYTLPGDGSIQLTNGPYTMAVDLFTASPGPTGMLSGSSLLISIGATLTVNNLQAPGTYTGSFPLIVDYQ